MRPPNLRALPICMYVMYSRLLVFFPQLGPVLYDEVQVCTFSSTERGGRGRALDEAVWLPSKCVSDETVLGSGFQLLLIPRAG